MNDELSYPANKQEPTTDPLRGLKDTIIHVGRSRAQYFTGEDLDDKSEEELKKLLAALNESPVLIYEDAPFRNPAPSMMMTYAGPRMPNGGMANPFFQTMNQQMMNQAPQPAQEQQNGQSDFCRTCGSPLEQRSRFCPNCGAELHWE